MRISDWSSDVCSSDLQRCERVGVSTRTAWRSLARDRGADRDRRDLLEPRFGMAPDADRGGIPVLHHPSDGDRGGRLCDRRARDRRSEEHTSELQSLMRISYAVFCLKTKKNNINHT